MKTLQFEYELPQFYSFKITNLSNLKATSKVSILERVAVVEMLRNTVSPAIFVT